MGGGGESAARDGRRILRCHGKTTNEAVLGELGWWRLQTRREFLKLKYWIKVCLMEESRLVRKVYRLSREVYSRKGVHNWCYEVRLLLKKYELDVLWANEDLVRNPPDLDPENCTVARVKKYWESRLMKVIHEVEEKEWLREMGKKEKLRTYRTFKKKLVLERYLLSEKEKKGRYLLTAIRAGTNKLRVETGRWKRPVEKKEDRVCIQCGNGEIEDEKHFILRCHRFQDLRLELFVEVRDRIGVDLGACTEEKQWEVLMSDEKEPGEVSDVLKKFVRKALGLRSPTG